MSARSFHPLSCAFIGDDSLLIRCAETARQRDHVVRCVITAARAVTRWAEAAGIPTIDAEGDVERELETLLTGDLLDYVFSVANLRPVSRRLLSAARAGINFHDGPLPRFGGVHAPAWAIMAGERDYAITWHRMTDRLDAGSILLQHPVAIDDDETSLTLNLKCFEAGAESFGTLIDGLARDALPERENALDRSTYHRRSDRVAGAATLDWRNSPQESTAIVRALDFGGYRNTLGAAKAMFPNGLFIVRRAVASGDVSSGAPGTVVRADAEGVVVATRSGNVRLERFATLEGVPLGATEAISRGGIVAGQSLSSTADRARLSALDRESAPHEEFWVRQFAHEPLDLPLFVRAQRSPHIPAPTTPSWRWHEPLALQHEAHTSHSAVSAALGVICAWLGHTTGTAEFTVSLSPSSTGRDLRGLEPWFSDSLPLHVELLGRSLDALSSELAATLERLTKAGVPLRDLIGRTPDLRHTVASSPVVVILGDGDTPGLPASAALVFAIDAQGRIRIGFDAGLVDENVVRSCGQQLAALLESARSGAPVERWSLLDAAAREQLARTLAGETLVLDHEATISGRFADQVLRTPEAVAVVGSDRRMTYREVDDESERLAHRLRALGVAADVPVGVCVERSANLLVSVLGILKAGGAYVPLDPSYPPDRLRYMIEDSGAPLVVTSRSLVPRAPAAAATQVIALEDVLAADATVARSEALPRIAPSALAYIIYTSGSTGTPKGVMLEHRNVTSFFAAMDALLGTAPLRWLAVTSLSFDISVLELLWPLTHGSTVVVGGEREGHAAPRLAFSLFYFSADERAQGGERYRLLLEGARFADTHGFAAVWTPERHFHEFGGIFPNPSVTSAAVAAITNRVSIRAGSVVLPLHHPLRIAEEWSVVDNLSNGRVAISFASGWRPEDFVLRPEGYKDAKKRMLDGIDTVRRLWRGESLPFEGPDGTPVEVAIHPRPVQPELPVFITAAGSPDTFEAAGKSGAGILTHLLGQTLDELREKIGLYRSARAAAGHAGPGHVALMLHTFVGDSDDEVKNLVRGPMKAYLRTSVSLIEKNAQAFPTFKKRPDGTMPKLDFKSLSEQEADALLEYSFERYFETSGMFGTVERCAAMAERLAAIGVDDVACLIDFGVDPALVLRHLSHLDAVRARFETAPAASVPTLLRDHRITHLQCTPSQALLLLGDPAARASLAELDVLLVGGEALSQSLATALLDCGVRRLINMYGPTETTVWSTSHDVVRIDGPIPIGRPIANTFVRIGGLGGSPAPPGVPGELLIGGPGVARGYLKRADLTRERFIAVDGGARGRMYRTGDQVRLNQRGELEFLGRGDTQVKVRGYRIELGEIERALARHAAVSEAVVVAWGERAEDRRLVGYVTLHAELPNAGTALREQLRTTLPEFMVPSQIVILAEFPRTPNGKTDRRNLPSPDQVERTAAPARVVSAAPTPAASSPGTTVPAAELQRSIADIWCDVLHVESVGLDENFFDVGGHSLLAVQVHQRVKSAIGRDFPITDLFRFSTVRALAAHLGAPASDAQTATTRGADRAAMRRQASQRRQQQ